MKRYRINFNNSFQRAVVPDPDAFYRRFYEKLIAADTRVADLFKNTEMDLQITRLKQSMTYIMSFSATLEPDTEMERIAEMHGGNKLDIPSEFYDIWLDCMIKTVEEFDMQFDTHIETSWRVMMAPGIEYMKTFCTR